MASTKGRIRPVAESDAVVLAQIFAHAWLEAYSGILPEPYIARMVQKRGELWWRQAAKHPHVRGTSIPPLVLEVDGVVAGYALVGPVRGNRQPSGEIYELYLDPAFQGQGLGELLFEGARHALDLEGLPGLTVWLLADNARAATFYWRRGGRPGARRTEHYGRRRLALIAYEFD